MPFPSGHITHTKHCFSVIFQKEFMYIYQRGLLFLIMHVRALSSVLFGAAMETDTSAFGASLSACGCQKRLHTSMCLNSWLQCSGRKWPLGAQQRKATQSLLPLLKCNNGDEALDLWSEYELGGACPVRQASYWWKRKGDKKSPE